jgi:hypothetical protein
MAQMIGARRNSVWIVAHVLQPEKYIRYSHGHVEILNLEASPKWPANATPRSRLYTRIEFPV